MKFRSLVIACLLAINTVGAAQATLVRVYYPEGHYLGCGTPAADGSGIWTYDPKISEADCQDRQAPNVSAYVNAFRLQDFEKAAAGTLSNVLSSGSDSVNTDTQVGAGVLLHINDWFAVDVGFGAGMGDVTRTRSGTDVERAIARSRFDMFAGSVAGRFYPIRGSRIKAWVSAGVTGLALEPAGGSLVQSGRETELRGQDFQRVTSTDLSAGAGVDIGITPRFGVTISANHGFGSGTRAAVGLAYRFRPLRPQPWPPTGTCPYAGCQEWPFAYAGDVHNQGLEFVLRAIQREAAVPPVRPRTAQDLRKLADVATQQFLQSRGITGSPEPLDPKLMEGLSSGQRRYIGEIDKAIETATPGSMPGEMMDLGRTAIRELGSLQARPVLLAGSVAAASSAYWNDRAYAWDEAVDLYLGIEDPPPAAIWLVDLVIEVVQEDVKGAVCGALKEGAKGEDPGKGAIEGAVEKSAEAILDALLTPAVD